MGFYVSTLHNLPTGNIKHFVHVLDMTSGIHARWIAENLQALASGFGPSAGLVTGTENLTDELYRFLMKHVTENFGAVESVLHSATCVVISEGHLSRTKNPVYLLPLTPPEESEAAQEMIAALLRMLAASIKEDRMYSLMASLGAIELGLTKAGGGLIVCTLREINRMLELKPNVAGLGINLNAIVEKLLPPEARAVGAK
jgi:hypothetical protein